VYGKGVDVLGSGESYVSMLSWGALCFGMGVESVDREVKVEWL
jgi:hypothetical protein